MREEGQSDFEYLSGFVEAPIGEILYFLAESHHIENTKNQINKRTIGLGEALAYKALLDFMEEDCRIGDLGLPIGFTDIDISNKMNTISQEYEDGYTDGSSTRISGTDLALYQWAYWTIVWLLREESLIETFSYRYQGVICSCEKTDFASIESCIRNLVYWSIFDLTLDNIENFNHEDINKFCTTKNHQYMVNELVKIAKPRIRAYIAAVWGEEDLLETLYTSNLWDVDVECGKKLPFKKEEQIFTLVHGKRFSVMV